MVHEHVLLSVVTGQEAKPLAVVEPLHGAGCCPCARSCQLLVGARSSRTPTTCLLGVPGDAISSVRSPAEEARMPERRPLGKLLPAGRRSQIQSIGGGACSKPPGQERIWQRPTSSTCRAPLRLCTAGGYIAWSVAPEPRGAGAVEWAEATVPDQSCSRRPRHGGCITLRHDTRLHHLPHAVTTKSNPDPRSRGQA